MKQLTWRAVIVGMLLGSILSLTNLYANLKMGWSFGVALTAGIISFALWNAFVRLGISKSPMTILENTCMQSAASSAGYSTGGTLTSAVAALLQARCEKLTEIPEKVDFFDQLPDYGVECFTNKKSKTNPEVSQAMLEAAIPALEGIGDWTADAVHDTLIALAEHLGVKNATLMWPVRIAAAGKLVTPGGAVEICHILGKDETLRRLRLGLDKLRA